MPHFWSISTLPRKFAAADITVMLLGGMQGGIRCGKVCVPHDAQGVHVLGSTEKLSLFVCLWVRAGRATLVCWLRKCSSFIFLPYSDTRSLSGVKVGYHSSHCVWKKIALRARIRLLVVLLLLPLSTIALWSPSHKAGFKCDFSTQTQVFFPRS